MKAQTQASATYRLGIMHTPIEQEITPEVRTIIDRAVEQVKEMVTGSLDLEVQVFQFVGPHLLPTEGAYSPFDFLRIGMAEKLERQVHFLLIVSEVDLIASRLSYVLGLPSQVMNIGIVSTRRLSPSFWGASENLDVTTDRLAALLLHTFGHLLNLKHDPNPSNVMYLFDEVEDLDQMKNLRPEQLELIRRELPREARDEVQKGNRTLFVARELLTDWRAVVEAVVRANPLHLISQLPTMVAAASSAMVLLFFTAEIWDLATTISVAQLLVFVVVALLVSTFVLYRAFSFRPILSRRKRLSESIVITAAATQLSLFVTMVMLYLSFSVVAYVASVTVFPRELMLTWPTVDPAVGTAERLQLGAVLGVIGVLAGSLGGRADSKNLIRYVLFLNEET